MPLPQKSYFFVPEVAERWGATVSDIATYAHEGLIQLCAMAVNLHVQTGYYEHIEEDDYTYIPTGQDVLNGPQPVRADDVWRILQDKIGSISTFATAHQNGVLQLCEGVAPLRLTLHQLLITRDERNRFECEYGLSVSETDSKQAPVFTHSSNYSEVTLRGERFSLGPSQACVMRELHAAYLRGELWLNQQDLLRSCARSTRLVDLFKSQPNWRDLFVLDGRGACRLNLPDQAPPKSRRVAFRRAVSNRNAATCVEAVDKAS
jgi:hypothetical protein